MVDDAAFRQAETDFDARVKQHPKLHGHKPCWNEAEKGAWRQKSWSKWGHKRGNKLQCRSRMMMRNQKNGSAIDSQLAQWPKLRNSPCPIPWVIWALFAVCRPVLVDANR